MIKERLCAILVHKEKGNKMSLTIKQFKNDKISVECTECKGMKPEEFECSYCQDYKAVLKAIRKVDEDTRPSGVSKRLYEKYGNIKALTEYLKNKK